MSIGPSVPLFPPVPFPQVFFGPPPVSPVLPAIAETFNSGTVLDGVPVGWVIQNDPVPNPTTVSCWVSRPATGFGSGKVARGTLEGSSNYLTKRFTRAVGSGEKLRVRMGTDQSPAATTRCATCLFYSGSTLGFGLLLHSNGQVLAFDMASANTVLLATYTNGVIYDFKTILGTAGTIASIDCNGTLTSNVGTMSNSLTTVDTVRFDTYNGGLTPKGHAVVDSIVSDQSTAAPNGTLLSAGWFDGYALGTNIYGEALIAYANGGSPASAIQLVERSADGGTNWAPVFAGQTTTAAGFVITDSRPQYGSQPVSVGNTATYRVTAMNASGDQVV